MEKPWKNFSLHTLKHHVLLPVSCLHHQSLFNSSAATAARSQVHQHIQVAYNTWSASPFSMTARTLQQLLHQLSICIQSKTFCWTRATTQRAEVQVSCSGHCEQTNTQRSSKAVVVLCGEASKLGAFSFKPGPAPNPQKLSSTNAAHYKFLTVEDAQIWEFSKDLILFQ